jgi:NarL family two-component system sensor histidine kinase LiaS
VIANACAPEAAAAEIGERIIEANGKRQSELVGETAFGERIISRRAKAPVAIAFGPNLSIIGAEAFLVALAAAISIAALPLAVLAARLVVQPQSRRLAAIANMSRRFAEGDFDARVNDARRDEIGDLARQFDDMAAALAQNIDALRDLERRNAALAGLAQQSAVAAERVRLSRDLHDSIAQQLFTLSLTASTLPDLIRTDAREAKHKARAIAELCRHTLSDLQTVLIDPRPSPVLQLGLARAIESLCSEWQRAQRTPVECSALLGGHAIAPEVEDIVYRVTQEALNNVARHAQARAVQVSLVAGPRQIALAVSDDGVGFEPDRVADGRLGLRGMRERAQAIDARLTIESERGRGATLQLSVRLERKQNHDD